MLKHGGSSPETAIQILLNKCLQEGKIPDSAIQKQSYYFKKGDKTNIDNYCPISLLSNLYKLLMRILINKLTKKLDDYKPVEQAVSAYCYRENGQI